jgi:hypothetical protein
MATALVQERNKPILLAGICPLPQPWTYLSIKLRAKVWHALSISSPRNRNLNLNHLRPAPYDPPQNIILPAKLVAHLPFRKFQQPAKWASLLPFRKFYLRRRTTSPPRPRQRERDGVRVGDIAHALFH